MSSESLLEVVQALANLDNVVGNLQSLTVTINNVNYTVDPASVTSTTSVSCQTGQYADGTDCGMFTSTVFSPDTVKFLNLRMTKTLL